MGNWRGLVRVGAGLRSHHSHYAYRLRCSFQTVKHCLLIRQLLGGELRTLVASGLRCGP